MKKEGVIKLIHGMLGFIPYEDDECHVVDREKLATIIVNKMEDKRLVVVEKDKLTKEAGLIVVEKLLGKKANTELEALPRWRCISCRRLYEEYPDAVNCCKGK